MTQNTLLNGIPIHPPEFFFFFFLRTGLEMVGRDGGNNWKYTELKKKVNENPPPSP